jgi:hypothetical protein
VTGLRLNDEQRRRAEAAVEPAVGFLEAQNYPLGAALVRHAWSGGSSDDVVHTLSAYQNSDGGFGKGLEVDIASPVSNPFAARLAMQAMRAIDLDASEEMRDRLKSWLVANEDADGDWHFTREVYDAPLSPWFAAWEFPSLNPACCVVGNAIPLDITTPSMLQRVQRLFDGQASREQAASGDFYGMLPYVEYVGGAPLDDRDHWFDAIAEGIRKASDAGAYGDASHFFDQALPAGQGVINRLSGDLLNTWTERLLDEPLPDGGWPSPYNEVWRPWTTAMALLTLARLRDGV